MSYALMHHSCHLLALQPQLSFTRLWSFTIAKYSHFRLWSGESDMISPHHSKQTKKICCPLWQKLSKMPLNLYPGLHTHSHTQIEWLAPVVCSQGSSKVLQDKTWNLHYYPEVRAKGNPCYFSILQKSKYFGKAKLVYIYIILTSFNISKKPAVFGLVDRKEGLIALLGGFLWPSKDCIGEQGCHIAFRKSTFSVYRSLIDCFTYTDDLVPP